MATQNFGSAAARPQVAEINDNYEAIKADVSALAESVKKLAADQIGPAVEGAQDQAKQKLGDLEASIRRNPTQAAMVAAGVGFFIGLILSR